MDNQQRHQCLYMVKHVTCMLWTCCGHTVVSHMVLLCQLNTVIIIIIIICTHKESQWLQEFNLLTKPKLHCIIEVLMTSADTRNIVCQVLLPVIYMLQL